MRLFAEALTHATAASFGSPAAPGTAFFDVIRGLDPRVPERIVSLLHDVRHLGNRANHDHADDHQQALTALQVGHKLAGWFHTTFRARGCKAPPFVIPPNPADATAALRAELEASRAEAAQAAAKLASLEGTAAELERLKAEARAYKVFEDADVALELASEAEEARRSDRERFEAELSSIRSLNLTPPTPDAVEELAAVAAVAADTIELDEMTTRERFDERLR